MGRCEEVWVVLGMQCHVGCMTVNVGQIQLRTLPEELALISPKDVTPSGPGVAAVKM